MKSERFAPVPLRSAANLPRELNGPATPRRFESVDGPSAASGVRTPAATDWGSNVRGGIDQLRAKATELAKDPNFTLKDFASAYDSGHGPGWRSTANEIARQLEPSLGTLKGEALLRGMNKAFDAANRDVEAVTKGGDPAKFDGNEAAKLARRNPLAAAVRNNLVSTWGR